MHPGRLFAFVIELYMETMNICIHSAHYEISLVSNAMSFSSLTFLTLFFVIDSTANTCSPMDDSSIGTALSVWHAQ